MYLVVGLGNPGKQYEATRHNMGFDTVDRLVEDYNVPQGGVKFNAMYGKTMIGGEKVILMKPPSFMNLSGGPVREMANYFKLIRNQSLLLFMMILIWSPGSFASASREVRVDITGSKILSASLAQRNFSVLK